MATRKRTTTNHSGPARRALTPRGKAQPGVTTADAEFRHTLRLEPLSYLRVLVRDVPDFPKPGILFKDVTPLLSVPKGFALAVDLMASRFVGESLDAIVAIEARGFVFGAAMAQRLNLSFVPVRKPGKLPCQVDSVAYGLEYGRAELQMHQDALKPGARVLVVDDVLATGGTAAAAAQLVVGQGGVVVAYVFLIELRELDGIGRLGSAPVISVLQY